MSRIHIKVTQEDIDLGLAYEASSCPVALALQRELDMPGASLCSSNITVGEHNYNPPDEVRDFVVAFDNGKEVKPFSFTMPEPRFTNLLENDDA